MNRHRGKRHARHGSGAGSAHLWGRDIHLAISTADSNICDAGDALCRACRVRSLVRRAGPVPELDHSRSTRIHLATSRLLLCNEAPGGLMTSTLPVSYTHLTLPTIYSV